MNDEELVEVIAEAMVYKAGAGGVLAALRSAGIQVFRSDWPIVDKLNEAQIRKLESHRHDRGEDGWMNEEPRWLMQRLVSEVEELAAHPSWEEAADVANFAAMFVDVSRADSGGSG